MPRKALLSARLRLFWPTFCFSFSAFSSSPVSSGSPVTASPSECQLNPFFRSDFCRQSIRVSYQVLTFRPSHQQKVPIIRRRLPLLPFPRSLTVPFNFSPSRINLIMNFLTVYYRLRTSKVNFQVRLRLFPNAAPKTRLIRLKSG